MNIRYFGTDLDDYGHYLFTIGEYGLYDRNLDLKSIPFNPEEMPIRQKGENRIKGETGFYQIGDYTIFAIEGSCKDTRGNTKSVFFLKELLTEDEMIQRIKANPVAMQIIEKMPFKVRHAAFQTANT